MPVLFAYTLFLYGDWPTMLEIFFFTMVGLTPLQRPFRGIWNATTASWQGCCSRLSPSA